MTLTPSARPRQNLRRLRTHLWPILETAGAAVVAWYLAKLLLPGRETGFAPIAAVICLGATMGQQRERALELTGGVVLGVLIADLLVRLLGTGPLQVGLMVVLAMSAAALIGGGGMLMTEAGVSAIIIGSTAPSTLGLFPTRPIEALVGGAVAFGVHAIVFPPDPLLHAGRAANAVFSGLGRTLEDLAGALRTGDRAQAERALAAARSIDGDVRALGEALTLGRETARSAPLRWQARAALVRQEEIGRHLDFAARDTSVLARDTLRYTRSNGSPVPDLADAVGDLAQAIWALAAAFDNPGAREGPRRFALRAAVRASEAMARHADLTLTEIAGRIRSTAADLMRASQAGAPDETELAEASTEEMLADPPDTSAGGARTTPRDPPARSAHRVAPKRRPRRG
jgi:uncharacterized membrane protein YgaE (UPF0421/DUF939 family)